ncbi:MAG: glycosyltransferase family 87 protein [Terriglobales bacterium]
MRVTKWQRLISIFFVGMVAINAAILWYGRDFIFEGYGDFTAFYSAGKLIQKGEASAIYDREKQWEVQREFAGGVKIRNGPLPYIRPPFEALIFLPLAHFSYPTACLIWMAIKLVLLLSVPFLLQPYAVDGPLLAVPYQGVLCLAVGPVVLDLLQGQDSILFLFIFAMVLIALQSAHDFRAGTLLGLGLIKFPIVIPLLLVMALQRKGKVVLGFLTSALLLVGVSVALVGWRTAIEYPKFLWRVNRTSNFGVMAPASMPNLRGLITDFSGARGSWRTESLVVLAMIVGIGFAAIVWRHSDDADPRLTNCGFSLAMVIALLTSYYFSGYDVILLLIPVLVLGNSFLRSPQVGRWAQILFFASIAVLMFASLYRIFFFGITRDSWKALVLLALAATLARAMKTWRIRKTSAA